MRYRLWSIAACLVAVLVAVEQAEGAPILTGHEVSTRFEALPTPGVFGGPVTVTVVEGGDPEIMAFPEPNQLVSSTAYHIDFGADYIRFDVLTHVTNTVKDFNGLVFELVNPDAVPDFTNVFIESSTLSGFTAAWIEFTADSIRLNFSGLTFQGTANDPESLTLRIEAASDTTMTPEPASVLLWTLGVAGMGWSALRRRSRH